MIYIHTAFLSSIIKKRRVLMGSMLKTVIVAMLAGILLSGCSSITKDGNMNFVHVKDAADLAKVNNSTASMAPFVGHTMYTFEHNFSKAEPKGRSLECLGYVRKVAPSEWGEAFGELTTQGVFDSIRDALTDEIRERPFNEMTIFVALMRAAIDGGRTGHTRGLNKIASLIAGCYNSGGETWMANTLANSPDSD